MSEHYGMRVAEAAVQIDTIYKTADLQYQSPTDMAEAMMGVISLVATRFNKPWAEVEIDVLMDLVNLPGVDNTLKESSDALLSKRGVDFSLRVRDNIN